MDCEGGEEEEEAEEVEEEVEELGCCSPSDLTMLFSTRARATSNSAGHPYLDGLIGAYRSGFMI